MSDLIPLALQVLDTYIQGYRPELTKSLLYQVVKTIIPKLGDQELLEAEIANLTEQVISEYNLHGLPKVPPPVNVKAIAAQVAEEIDQYLKERSADLPPTDVTKSESLGDLEVGSNLRKKS